MRKGLRHCKKRHYEGGSVVVTLRLILQRLRLDPTDSLCTLGKRRITKYLRNPQFHWPKRYRDRLL